MPGITYKIYSFYHQFFFIIFYMTTQQWNTMVLRQEVSVNELNQ
jgi:hypothetical protein